VDGLLLICLLVGLVVGLFVLEKIVFSAQHGRDFLTIWGEFCNK